jgi:hypothetical protein
MMDVKKYWEEVRAIEGSLPDYVWMVSVVDLLRGRVGEAIVEVGAALAAKLLIERSHRVATEDEVRAHKESEDAQKRAAVEEKLRKAGRAIVPVREKI